MNSDFSENEEQSREKAPTLPKAKKEDLPELKRPIIFICNDFYAKALRPLKELVIPLKVVGPTTEDLSKRVHHILREEDVFSKHLGLVTKVVEGMDGDARSCLNTL